MFRFLESICFKEGSYQLLDYHQIRVNQTFGHFYPGEEPLNLKKILPRMSELEKMKVRLTYNEKEYDLSESKYRPKPLSTLRLVLSDAIDYTYKYLDRTKINELLNPGSISEDIIIIKEGRVTDSSYSNLIFKQEDVWYTPKTFLLNGVKRQQLLNAGLILEKDIRIQDLKDYTEVSLINAMLDPGDLSLPVRKIIS